MSADIAMCLKDDNCIHQVGKYNRCVGRKTFCNYQYFITEEGFNKIYRNILSEKEEKMANDERDMLCKKSDREHPAYKSNCEESLDCFPPDSFQYDRGADPIDGSKIAVDLITKEHFNTLPDSGERREFSTGSVRDIRTGKGRFDLISPIALRRLAVRLEDGMSKYGERNWEKGQPLMSYLDSAVRHIQDFIEDVMCDVEHKEDHLGAALWNIHGFIHTEEMIKRGCLPEELDDLPTPARVGIDHESS